MDQKKKNLLMLNWARTRCETGENLWLGTPMETLVMFKAVFVVVVVVFDELSPNSLVNSIPSEAQLCPSQAILE